MTSPRTPGSRPRSHASGSRRASVAAELTHALRRAADAQRASRRARAAARRSCEALGAHIAEVGDHLDLARARRTVPRGAAEGDWRPSPAVSFGVWLTHVRYARTGDPSQLSTLVREYEGYALSLAYRMHRDREPLDDLEQVAREALVTALQRFEPERGIPFPAYAAPTVLGALRRHYRDHGWSVRVPRRVHELAHARQQCVERLTPELGREPTPHEVAAELGIDVEELRAADGALRARATDSLDVPVGDDGPPIADAIPSHDRDLLASDDRLALAEALTTLDERARDLIDLYYVRELTQSQIAERYGVSQMQVSRWLSSIVARLRSQMAVA